MSIHPRFFVFCHYVLPLVSDAEIKKVLAMEFDFDEDTLADIYDRSIREVRSTNGFVNLIETVKRTDEERESFRWRDEYR